MNLIKILWYKIYYGFFNGILKKSYCEIPESLKNTKNIFIYFDYEREFSGHNTSIKDENIEHLLDILNFNSIKSTWFTVGKVIEKYPNSVKAILKNGHELGSHTFSHKAPFETPSHELKKDFCLFSENLQKFNCEINGFHSPRGRWSYECFKLLRNYNFTYEVVGNEKSSLFTPFYLTYLPNKQFFRLHTLGDDWPIFRDKIHDKEKIFDYFVEISRHIGKGEVAGIGFHPWILVSNENILKAFEEFLSYLKQQNDVRLETAITYFNLCK